MCHRTMKINSVADKIAVLWYPQHGKISNGIGHPWIIILFDFHFYILVLFSDMWVGYFYINIKFDSEPRRTMRAEFFFIFIFERAQIMVRNIFI